MWLVIHESLGANLISKLPAITIMTMLKLLVLVVGFGVFLSMPQPCRCRGQVDFHHPLAPASSLTVVFLADLPPELAVISFTHPP